MTDLLDSDKTFPLERFILKSRYYLGSNQNKSIKVTKMYDFIGTLCAGFF